MGEDTARRLSEHGSLSSSRAVIRVTGFRCIYRFGARQLWFHWEGFHSIWWTLAITLKPIILTCHLIWGQAGNWQEGEDSGYWLTCPRQLRVFPPPGKVSAADDIPPALSPQCPSCPRAEDLLSLCCCHRCWQAVSPEWNKLVSELPPKEFKCVNNYGLSWQVLQPSEGLLSMCHTLEVIFWSSFLPSLLLKENSIGNRHRDDQKWVLCSSPRTNSSNRTEGKSCTDWSGDRGNKMSSVSWWYLGGSVG